MYDNMIFARSLSVKFSGSSLVIRYIANEFLLPINCSLGYTKLFREEHLCSSWDLC